jgi:hypothetical protein
MGVVAKDIIPTCRIVSPGWCTASGSCQAPLRCTRRNTKCCIFRSTDLSWGQRGRERGHPCGLCKWAQSTHLRSPSESLNTGAGPQVDLVVLSASVLGSVSSCTATGSAMASCYTLAGKTHRRQCLEVRQALLVAPLLQAASSAPGRRGTAAAGVAVSCLILSLPTRVCGQHNRQAFYHTRGNNTTCSRGVHCQSSSFIATPAANAAAPRPQLLHQPSSRARRAHCRKHLGGAQEGQQRCPRPSACRSHGKAERRERSADTK